VTSYTCQISTSPPCFRSFGNEGTDNEEKLTAFIEAVNSSDGNSHLVTVPAGTILSDQLFGSPIYQHDGGAGYAAGPGAAAEVPRHPLRLLQSWQLNHLYGGDPPLKIASVHAMLPSPCHEGRFTAP
jgi:hypothetical protein